MGGACLAFLQLDGKYVDTGWADEIKNPALHEIKFTATIDLEPIGFPVGADDRNYGTICWQTLVRMVLGEVGRNARLFFPPTSLDWESAGEVLRFCPSFTCILLIAWFAVDCSLFFRCKPVNET